MVESDGEQNQEANIGIDEGWFLSDVLPSSHGAYSIETVEKVVWSNFPITEANWNGKKWVDDGGESINVKQWKELNH